MLSQKVGACFAKTFSKIAEYFEFEQLDYRKADKVYRIGLDHLKLLDTQASPKKSNTKELESLNSLYERFSERMMRRVEQEAVREINEVRRNSTFEVRPTKSLVDKVRAENE